MTGRRALNAESRSRKDDMTARYLHVPRTLLRPFVDAEAAARHVNRGLLPEEARHARILDPAEAETVRAAEFPDLPAIPPAGPPRVRLLFDDIDRHGSGCGCGLCDVNGRSYGVGIFPAETPGLDPVDRVYACSEASALHNARLACERTGQLVIDDED